MRHPIGAKWTAKDDRGRIGEIKLTRRYFVGHRVMELWEWSVVWDDGSGYKWDTCGSYRKCREEIPLFNKDYLPPRFKKAQP